VGQYVFERGSNILEYWLANAEGFLVRARGSRVGVVRRVSVDPVGGRATDLVLRTRLHGTRVVPATTIVAVDPARQVLELDVEERPLRLAGFAGRLWGRRRIAVSLLARAPRATASRLAPRIETAGLAVLRVARTAATAAARRLDETSAWLRPRLAAAALAAVRVVRAHVGDAYQSCRTGRVRVAARHARRGAEWAVRRGSFRAAGGVRRLSHRSVHGLRRGSLRIRAYRARP
jgi:hypothetical protein